jgi:hypothetical protein
MYLLQSLRHVIISLGYADKRLSAYNLCNIYPAMTAFTDQYSLPNIFFDIGQL